MRSCLFGSIRLKHAFGNFRRQDHTKAARAFGWGRVRSHALLRVRSALLVARAPTNLSISVVRLTTRTMGAHAHCFAPHTTQSPCQWNLCHPTLINWPEPTFLLTLSTLNYPHLYNDPSITMWCSFSDRPDLWCAIGLLNFNGRRTVWCLTLGIFLKFLSDFFTCYAFERSY